MSVCKDCGREIDWIRTEEGRYMSMSWRKNDGARAKKIQAEERASVEGWLVSLVKDAIRQIKAGK